MTEVTDTVTIPADGKKYRVEIIPTYAMGSAWPADAPPCAACEHPAAEHCGKCGCGRGVGTRDECICARYVRELFPCPACGHVFKYRHELQVHTIPVPACVRVAGVAAAGKYADRPDLAAPLAGMTSGAVQLGQRPRRRRTARGK